FALIRKASSPTLPASADGGGEKLAASTAPKRTRDRLTPSPPHAVMRALSGGGHHVRSAEPFRTGQAGRPGTVRAARQRHAAAPVRAVQAGLGRRRQRPETGLLRLRRHRQVRGLGQAQGHRPGRREAEIRRPGEEAGGLTAATMAARQTRQRILDCSLAMFNAQGEPNVTTNHIADELEISPGNLYYHFRNKDDIIEPLVARFDARMDDALAAPDGRLPGLEDIWLQLHLAFECIWDYRFLYRDLVEILSRNRRLRVRFARILKRADDNAHQVMRGLSQAGVMRASAA